MEYLSKFDSDGKRITSVPRPMADEYGGEEQLLSEGYVVISEEDFQYYIGNNGTGENGTGFVRDAETGKPISAPPPPPPAIEDLKAEKLAQVDTWTQQAITGGFISKCTGAPVRYDSDVDTQRTMQGIALNATSARFVAEYPQGCPCRGYAEGSDTKSIFLLTGEQVLGFCADLSAHIGQCKQRGWELQAAVHSAATAEELEALKF